MTNPQYDFIQGYLKKVRRPSFTKFSCAKEKEIIKKSVSIPFNDSLGLQNIWIRYYNNTTVTRRPKAPTAATATRVSDVFKRIFREAKALKETRSKISAASITCIGNQAESSVALLKKIDDVEEQYIDTEGDEIEEEVEDEEDEEEELTEDYYTVSKLLVTSFSIKD